mmetsp:Transcript_92/g.150  ORF Transcript_92/g.150 Transcript_92/m.150 type:complete len:142 (-) Transcript_92:217-642(-)
MAAPLIKPKTVKAPTAGKGWFDMPAAEMTAELRRDVQAVRLRGYLDPARFYKAPEVSTRFLQRGTVVEGRGEFYSARIARRGRRPDLVEEILADDAVRQYSKRKFQDIQKQKSRGKKGFHKNKKHSKQKGSRSSGAGWGKI